MQRQPFNRNNPRFQIKKQKNTLLNDGIEAPELRVIDHNGQQLGIISTREALAIARENNTDLFIIGANQKPPVAKIMDYGKYKFEQEKQEKEQKKKNKAQSTVKEVKMTPRIEEHDLIVKTKKVVSELKGGNKVRVVVEMKGRELQHPEIGRAILQKILEQIIADNIGKSDRQPPIKIEGRSMTLQLAPLV